jgi:hypothetical protein
LKASVYQIFYNADTRAKVAPGFLPLDNTRNERPDWFEFWVILNFLRKNPLEEGAWYGFLSPKFGEKTGFTPGDVRLVLDEYGDRADVALFTIAWDQLCYFLNPWEQGEVWHPGLTSQSQSFLSHAGREIDLQALVTDLSTSVCSNYIVAKKPFWLAWKEIAEQFFEYEEAHVQAESTSYGSAAVQYPMKTFIQERFASLILATGTFSVFSPDHAARSPIYTRMFPNDEATRQLLRRCDGLKRQFRQSGERSYLDGYWKARREIRYTAPHG